MDGSDVTFSYDRHAMVELLSVLLVIVFIFFVLMLKPLDIIHICVYLVEVRSF